jgi:peptide/nickel transport system substrate-binding protein
VLSRARKLRLRRELRMRKLQLQSTGEQADKYFIRRLDRLTTVRRFVVAWIVFAVALIVASVAQNYALSSHYQSLQPAPGGIYTEGIAGSFTNVNPIYAATSADRTVSRLLFSSLLTYNERNQLTGDLAESWKADSRGQKYTIHLRDNLHWHDGQSLTASDVLFTYKTIQNPDALSPLNSSWKGVKVEAPDAHTVIFTLPNPLVSFPHSLTNGILPEHILGKVPMTDMRSTAFNTANPIGSGPFRWRELHVSGNVADNREAQITLSAFDNYHNGRPKLDSFTVRIFQSEQRMIDSYKRRELQAMVGLMAEPNDVKEPMRALSFPQTAATMTFFKTTSGVLADKVVRQALVQGANTAAIRRQLGYAAPAVDAPLLKKQLGYDKSLTQLSYNPEVASKQLQDSGWVVGADSIRQKGNQKLEFKLLAENNSEAARTSRLLQQQWRKIGVDAKVELLDPAQFQLALSQHGYDALLHGVSIGNDPDVFVYWHSSQADILSPGRLNFSEYKSKIADDALEQARTRTDVTLRTAKYKPFLTSWRDDAPAFGLYQPRFLYITRDPVYRLNTHEVNSATDRFANVEDWMIRRVKTTVD